jgi:leucyl-tRNA synthetase
VFRLAEGLPAGGAAMPEAIGDAARTLRRVTHRTIAAVSEALDNFAFNVAVARLYELANAIADADPRNKPDDDAADAADMVWARREAVEALARLSAPMMPHLAEEVYSRLHPGTAALVADLTWPEADADLLTADTVTIAVQVMGKLRGTITAPPDAPQDVVLAAAKAETNVARALEGKRIVKQIHVPNRIVNFVIAG